MDSLQKARNTINQIDRAMIDLFEQRMDAVKQVVSYKQEHHLPVLDADREAAVIANNSHYLRNVEYRPYYEEFIQATMRISRAYQKEQLHHDQVAYAGTLGAFSHIAAMKLFPEKKLIHLPTFAEVVEKVEQGEAAYGVLPFENSYTGEVGENMDLILAHDIFIHQMYDLKIEQNLLGIKGSSIEAIRQVYSKDQAISQSRKFLEGRHIECIAYPNTAMAAQYIAEQQDPHKAAIASKETAALYDLQILAENINTSTQNTTRFIVIAKKPPQSGNRIALVFTVPHTTGSLAKVMSLISDHGFNMESIHSRSLKDEPFAYYFYVELVAHLDSPQFTALYEAMKPLCKKIKIAGSYTLESRDKV